MEGGRPRNGYRADQQRRDDTITMILEVEVHRSLNLHHQVEVGTTSRTRIIGQISTASHKVMRSITDQKKCITMAHRDMTTENMGTMNFLLRPRTVGHQRSTMIVFLTATTRLTKTSNIMLGILSEIEKVHTTGGSLRAVIDMTDLLDSRKRQ